MYFLLKEIIILNAWKKLVKPYKYLKFRKWKQKFNEFEVINGEINKLINLINFRFKRK